MREKLGWILLQMALYAIFIAIGITIIFLLDRNFRDNPLHVFCVIMVAIGSTRISKRIVNYLVQIS